MHWLDAAQQGQRGYLMPWSPVFFGIGVALYFALPEEPGAPVYGGLAALAVCAALLGRWRREQAGPLMTALVLVALGLCVGGLRTMTVAGPVLEFRYYGPVEGRIVAVDRPYNNQAPGFSKTPLIMPIYALQNEKSLAPARFFPDNCCKYLN
ncbi:MAG: hypothetical protein R6U99_09825 [Nioella sp.]